MANIEQMSGDAVRLFCGEASSPLSSLALLLCARVCSPVLHGFDPSPGRFTFLQDPHPCDTQSCGGTADSHGLLLHVPLFRDGDGSCSSARTTGVQWGTVAAVPEDGIVLIGNAGEEKGGCLGDGICLLKPPLL